MSIPGSSGRFRSLIPWLAVLALACVLPFLASSYALQLVSRVLVLAIFAMSLDLLVGVTGLVSLGHAAFYGAAAYFLVWMSPVDGAANLLWSLPLTVLGCMGLALVIGALAIRTTGIYFIMVTLAFGQLLYYVIHDTPFGGGTDGVYLTVKPTLDVLGMQLLDLERVPHFYALCAGLALGTYAFLRALTRTALGHALVGVRVNEHRMQALGHSTYFYKLAAFVLAGAGAGIAGYLAVCEFGFANPEMLAWHLSGTVLVMVILGGKGNFHGAAVGAIVYTALEELLSNAKIAGVVADHWKLPLGLIIIAVALFLPRGLLGLLGDRRQGPR